ncbi:hypothetical protein [Bernardetia litoralis]|uniref:hypothetical protein n=1 Tax=Bernardetia litoralis TaxID=999 RepID=UPI0012FDFE2A|nr:hypothetical protein [Bernardetia litoralis]
MIPKIQEEAKKLIEKIKILLDKCEISRREKSKAFNLCIEYFVISSKLNINIVFHFCILGQNNIVVKFILDDKESEFVKQLKKYNQILRENGRAEFQYLYVSVMRKKEKLLVEDKVILIFYHTLSKIFSPTEEITEEGKFKIIYQIVNST